MRSEWDERKRVANLEKHELDFLDADLVFERPYFIEPARSVGDELREKAVGFIEDRLVTLVFTRRGEVFRVISLRRARQNERRAYRELHG